MPHRTDLLYRTKLFQLVKALRGKEKIVLVGATITFTVTAFIYGILYLQTKTHPVAAQGGEFQEGIVGQPVYINPVFPGTEVDRDIARLVFSSVAEVAESIKRSDDGKEWNVRLKENVLWHDGERLTADDIIFTLETIENPESRSPLYASFQGVAAQRISELEVKFVLQNPYAFFDSDHLQNLRIIPKHILADIPVQNLRLSSYVLKPVGSGPYETVSYETGGNGIIQSFQLKANERYFGDKPNIKTLTLKFYRSASELVKAYNLGQIDGFGLGVAEPLASNKIRIRHQLLDLQSPRYYAIFINQNSAPKELKNLEVRKALTATIDRERIIKDIFLSHATPIYGPTTLTPNQFSDYNPQVLQGLKLNLVVPDEPFLVRTAQIVKENWESKGVQVNLTIMTAKTIREEVLKKSNYELILFGNITKESQDLFAFWHSSQRFYPDQNLALYKNSKTDSELEQFRKTFDTDKRLELLKLISNTIAADIPAIFLYSPDYIYIAVPKLGGFNESKLINTSDDRFSDIEKWYVKTRRARGKLN